MEKLPYQYHTDQELRQQARQEAYKRVYTDIYRSMMRYNNRDKDGVPILDLSEEDCQFIDKFYDTECNSKKPLRYVVVGLAPDEEVLLGDDRSIKAIELTLGSKIERIMKKCYIGKCLISYELGDLGHPHLNILFESTADWLEKSRIIREFAYVFSVANNYVHVSTPPKGSWKRLESYCRKEGIWYRSNYDDSEKPKNKKFFSNPIVVRPPSEHQKLTKAVAKAKPKAKSKPQFNTRHAYKEDHRYSDQEDDPWTEA